MKSVLKRFFTSRDYGVQDKFKDIYFFLFRYAGNFKVHVTS